MTRNQLQFWDLAWKQHYQNVELSLKAYELALKADKQKLEWAKLEEQVRATLVAEALDERKQILSEYAAELELHYKSTQIAKMLAERDVMKQQMYLSLIKESSANYTSMTKQMIEIYSKMASIDLNIGGGTNSGGKGGSTGFNIGMSIKSNPFYMQMEQVAKDLGDTRDNITKLYDGLSEYFEGYLNYRKYEEDSLLPKVDETKANMESDLEQFQSKNANVKHSNRTIGPGIDLDSKSSKPSSSNAGERYAQGPQVRESQGPSSTSNIVVPGTKTISSNNVGPGTGKRSTPVPSKSSNVIISPGVKISSGPGYY